MPRPTQPEDIILQRHYENYKKGIPDPGWGEELRWCKHRSAKLPIYKKS